MSPTLVANEKAAKAMPRPCVAPVPPSLLRKRFVFYVVCGVEEERAGAAGGRGAGARDRLGVRTRYPYRCAKGCKYHTLPSVSHILLESAPGLYTICPTRCAMRTSNTAQQ